LTAIYLLEYIVGAADNRRRHPQIAKSEQWRFAMHMRVPFAALLLLGIASLPVEAKCLSTKGPSTSILVTGDVTKRTVFNLQALQKFSPAQANVDYFAGGPDLDTGSFTGALLWDILNLSPAGPITTNPSIKNDILHKIIIVTGCDGYQSVFGAGEIDPFFGGNQIIVAYEENGESLGQNGFAEVIAPGDKAGGRFVNIIDKIEVKDATK
jgi:hypothetical protein